MNFQPRLDLPTDIQRATSEEAPALSQLAIASKASWGFPPGWMDTASIYLQISPEYIARNPVYKAISGGEIAGWYSLRLQNGTSWLDNLWVAPAFFGQGIGRGLFTHTVQIARADGPTRLTSCTPGTLTTCATSSRNPAGTASSKAVTVFFPSWMLK